MKLKKFSRFFGGDFHHCHWGNPVSVTQLSAADFDSAKTFSKVEMNVMSLGKGSLRVLDTILTSSREKKNLLS